MIDAVKSQAEQKRVKDIEELTIQHENEQGQSKVKIVHVVRHVYIHCM